MIRLSEIPRQIFTAIEIYLALADAEGHVRVWPDGRPFLEQPILLTQAFDRIAVEIGRWRKSRQVR